jgi:exosortase A
LNAFAPLRRSAPALVLGLVLLSIIFAGEIVAAISVWRASTAYNHCFLILPIALWLIWDRRYRLAGLQPQPVWWALLPAAGFALFWLVANRLGVMEGQQLAAMGIVQSLLLGVLGWPIYRALIAPFLYLFFLIPFGGFLTPALQTFTTQFTAHGLDFLGIPNYVHGNTIEISAGVFYIAQACAGLRFLIAAIAFSVLYALLIFRSFWRRVSFIALSLFVPVIANGFRALGIVWLGHALGSAKAAATDHVLYGYIFFSIVLALLILLGLPFRQDHLVVRPTEALPKLGPAPRALILRALAIVAVAAIGPLLVAQANREVAANHLIAPPPWPGCTVISSGPVSHAGGVLEHMVCSNKTIHVGLALLPPKIDPKTVFDTLRSISREDHLKALSRMVTVPNVGLVRWQMVTTATPAEATLSTLFIDGRPMRANLITRFHEAWHSLLGGHHAQLVIGISTAGTGANAESRLFDFVEMADLVPTKLARLTEAAITRQ